MIGTLALGLVAWIIWNEVQKRKREKMSEGEQGTFDPTFLDRKFKKIEQYAKMIYCKSKVYKVNTWIIIAVMYHESGGQANVIGRDGEVGLMQIWPPTGEAYGYTVIDLFEPNNNIDCGVHVLCDEYIYFQDWDTAIRAYNTGRTLGGDNPEKVQRGWNYLKKVKAHRASVYAWWKLKGYDSAIGKLRTYT